DIVLGGSIEADIDAVRDDEKLDDAAKEKKIAEIREEWLKRHQDVLAKGGLHIIGTERHESRRVDNQLRGRAGRQGDPGSSRFYLSLEDPLLRIFASDRVSAIMQKLNMPEGEAIEHPWVTRAIENAQRKVEARNFDMRKQLLEYDDVSNDQRKVIYQQRNELLDATDISETVRAMRNDVLDSLVSQYIVPQSMEEEWDVPGLEKALSAEYQMQLPLSKWLKDEPELHEDALRERIASRAGEIYQEKVKLAGEELMRHYERAVMLQSLDNHWREHLAALDHLRQGIHLRGYAQKNPKQEYKREAFELFSEMLESIRMDVTQNLLTVQIRSEADVEAAEAPVALENVRYQHADYDEALASEDESEHQPFVRIGEKVGRNDPCPCGSGKKYKQCHGKLA
ncbi:MAG: preprotein translocase subunit SecA, partial [Burkholderiales bacterium]